MNAKKLFELTEPQSTCSPWCNICIAIQMDTLDVFVCFYFMRKKKDEKNETKQNKTKRINERRNHVKRIRGAIISSVHTNQPISFRKSEY